MEEGGPPAGGGSGGGTGGATGGGTGGATGGGATGGGTGGGAYVFAVGALGFREFFPHADGGITGVGTGMDLVGARPVSYFRGPGPEFLTPEAHDGGAVVLRVYSERGLAYLDSTTLCVDGVTVCGQPIDARGSNDACLGDFRAVAGAQVPSVALARSSGVELFPFVHTDLYEYAYFSSNTTTVGGSGVAGILELDVNGDGVIDLVTVTGATPPVVSVILGK